MINSEHISEVAQCYSISTRLAMLVLEASVTRSTNQVISLCISMHGVQNISAVGFSFVPTKKELDILVEKGIFYDNYSSVTFLTQYHIAIRTLNVVDAIMALRQVVIGGDNVPLIIGDECFATNPKETIWGTFAIDKPKKVIVRGFAEQTIKTDNGDYYAKELFVTYAGAVEYAHAALTKYLQSHVDKEKV